MILSILYVRGFDWFRIRACTAMLPDGCQQKFGVAAFAQISRRTGLMLQAKATLSIPGIS
jgi:hypothetical protein